MKVGHKKLLLKKRKCPSLHQSIQKCFISMVHTSSSAIIDSYFETSYRFRALFDDDSDDINGTNEISDYVEIDVCTSEFSEVVRNKTNKRPMSRKAHQSSSSKVLSPAFWTGMMIHACYLKFQKLLTCILTQNINHQGPR